MKIESSHYQITPLNKRIQSGTDAGDTNGSVESVQQVGAASAQNSTVNLSSMSTLRSSSDSDIDTAKVESIKAALRNGTYSIDSSKIADGMLNSASELLGKSSR
ncbi:flagellar biosynthesis anti-sigma factor FlgM [Paraburkholderia sp. PREW-6R]|uniref:flagellar biosynthesis anti-sigma factor FlgM n=1 Tax=Paraburkholderia sp. PREW-6R TaxID=3141544 RepID=UPI0031F47C4D